MKSAHTSPIHFSPSENRRPRRGFVQTRLQHFGLSMIVMGASFLLYYMGLFGGVEGPLEPARIGDTLASLGVSNYHVLGICLLFMVISLTWNHVYNTFQSILLRNESGRQQQQNRSSAARCCGPGAWSRRSPTRRLSRWTSPMT